MEILGKTILGGVMGRIVKGFLLTVVGLLAVLEIGGCAQVATGIEHAKLETSAKMSKTIFLNPVRLGQKTIFVQVKSTSQVPMPDLKSDVANYLTAKGYKIIQDPYKAHYWLQANVLYMGKESKHLTMAGALAGGFGGALIGSAFGSGAGRLGTMAVGGIIGSGLGMIAGAAIHVDRYMGIVDIQVKEKVNGIVQAKTTSNLKQGTGTTYHTTRTLNTSYQAYRTRVAADATQTDMNLKKAIPVLENKIARELAGIF